MESAAFLVRLAAHVSRSSDRNRIPVITGSYRISSLYNRINAYKIFAVIPQITS